MKKLSLLYLLLFSIINAKTLTLDEAIKATLQNYPDVKTMQMKLKQSELSHHLAYGDYLPQVNLNGEYNTKQTYILPTNGTFKTKDDVGWDVGVNLKQKLWDFSKTSSKISASLKDIEISRLSLMDFKALLSFKVKSLYKLMAVNKEAIKVRKEDLRVKEAYYKKALELVKQGLKTDADANRFLFEVYNAKENLAIAKSDFEKAKNTLSLYMGRKISKNIKLEKSILKKTYKLDSDIEKEILKNNYSLKIDDKNIEKNILLHKAAKAEHFGSIDAVASYNHFDTLNSYDSKKVGVVFNLPLYSGGKISTQAQKMKISTIIAKEQKLSHKLALKEQINNLLYDIKKYNATIKAKKAGLKYAKKTKKIVEGRYKEGLATYIELLDASTQVLNAKLGLLQAYYLKSLSIDKIQYLKGKIK